MQREPAQRADRKARVERVGLVVDDRKALHAAEQLRLFQRDRARVAPRRQDCREPERAQSVGAGRGHHAQAERVVREDQRDLSVIVEDHRPPAQGREEAERQEQVVEPAVLRGEPRTLGRMARVGVVGRELLDLEPAPLESDQVVDRDGRLDRRILQQPRRRRGARGFERVRAFTLGGFDEPRAAEGAEQRGDVLAVDAGPAPLGAVALRDVAIALAAHPDLVGPWPRPLDGGADAVTIGPDLSHPAGAAIRAAPSEGHLVELRTQLKVGCTQMKTSLPRTGHRGANYYIAPGERVAPAYLAASATPLGVPFGGWTSSFNRL
jgi:hypothetical protein